MTMSDRVLIGIHHSQLPEVSSLDIPVVDDSNYSNDEVSNTDHADANDKFKSTYDDKLNDSINQKTDEFASAAGNADKPSAPTVVADNVMMDDQPKPFIWRSISVHFYVIIFLQQILVHCFTPLTIIFSPNPRAQFFWFSWDWTWLQTIDVLVFSLLINSTTSVSIILYICMYYFEIEDYHHFSGSLLFPLLYAMLWRFSIAVRYASFSSEEYQTIMSATDYKTIRLYQQQTVVNQNYVDWENEQVVDFEIIAASLRVDCNPYECFFTIPNPADSTASMKMFLEWKAFLSINSTTYSSTTTKNEPLIETDLIQQPNGTYRVSMFHVCKRINRASQREAIESMAGFNRFIVFIFTCLIIITPFYGFTIGEYPTPSALTIAFLILSSWEIALFFYLVLGRFLFGAIVDQRRQAIVAECFGNMLRINDHVDDVLVNFSRPPSVIKKPSSSFKQRRNNQNSSHSNTDLMMTTARTKSRISSFTTTPTSFRTKLMSRQQSTQHQSSSSSSLSSSMKLLPQQHEYASTSSVIHTSNKEFRASKQAALARAIFMTNSQKKLLQTSSSSASPISSHEQLFTQTSGLNYDMSNNDSNHNDSRRSIATTPKTTAPLSYKNNTNNNDVVNNGITNNMTNNSNGNNNSPHDHRLARIPSSSSSSSVSVSASKMKRRSFTIYTDSTEKLQKMCKTNQCYADDAAAGIFDHMSGNYYSPPTTTTTTTNNNNNNNNKSQSASDDYTNTNNKINNSSSSSSLFKLPCEQINRLGHRMDVTPRLSFTHPENLFNWVQARLAMQTYKLRFRKRIEATTFFILLATISLIIVLLVLIFLPKSQQDKLAQFKTPLFWQTIFSVIIFCLFLIFYSFLASKVNEAYQKHRVLVGKHSLRINEETSYLEGQLVDIEDEQENTKSQYAASNVGGYRSGGHGSRLSNSRHDDDDDDDDDDSSSLKSKKKKNKILGKNIVNNNKNDNNNNNNKSMIKNKAKNKFTKAAASINHEKQNNVTNQGQSQSDDTAVHGVVEEHKDEYHTSSSSSSIKPLTAVTATVATALDDNMIKMENVVDAIMMTSSSPSSSSSSTHNNNSSHSSYITLNAFNPSNPIHTVIKKSNKAFKNHSNNNDDDDDDDDDVLLQQQQHDQQQLLLHDNSRLLHRQLVTCHNTAKQLNAVTDLLNITSEVQPMEVFGLKAELSLSVYFVSAGVSLFVLLLSVYISITQNLHASLV